MLILNGQLYEPGAPETTLLNRSFKYGDGLFETIRVYKGKALFIENHLERLFRGMAVLELEFDSFGFEQELRTQFRRLIAINKIQNEGKLRLHIYRSGGGAYSPLDHKPYYLIEGYSLKSDMYASDSTATLIPYKEVAVPNNILSPFKTANSLPYVLAGIHAQKHDFDDAVLFCEGNVSETASSNIFVVQNQKIFTPPLSSGCVDGIIRKQILDLAEQLKLSCSEKKLKHKDLIQSDEIFITNSLRRCFSSEAI